jgi:hypothetical protein
MTDIPASAHASTGAEQSRATRALPNGRGELRLIHSPPRTLDDVIADWNNYYYECLIDEGAEICWEDVIGGW